MSEYSFEGLPFIGWFTQYVGRTFRSEGVGSSSNNTEPFTNEEENTLWKEGIMETHSPQSLLTIFFTMGRDAAYKVVRNRYLKLSQFRKIENVYIYTENTSNNRSGSFKQLHSENKTVTLMRNETGGKDAMPTCLMSILNDCHHKRLEMKFSILLFGEV